MKNEMKMKNLKMKNLKKNPKKTLMNRNFWIQNRKIRCLMMICYMNPMNNLTRFLHFFCLELNIVPNC